MSTARSDNSSFLNDSNKVSIVATLATVILLAVAVIAGYYWGVSDAQKVQSQQKASNSQNRLSTSSLPTPPVPPVIYAYSGEVTSIDQGIVYIKASLQENGTSIEKDLKVAVSDSTQYSQLDVSKPPLPPGSEQTEEREKDIQLSEIRVGDRVIAQADENIKDKTEFQATKIRVLVAGL